MDHDQDIHHFALVYPGDLPSYPPSSASSSSASSSSSSSSSNFILSSAMSPRRFHSDAFSSPPQHEQHEAEHVYNSPPLALDPSTLNLRSNAGEISPPSSANPSGSDSSTPTGSLRLSSYSSSGLTTRRKTRGALGQIDPVVRPGSQQDHPQSDLHGIPMHSAADFHDSRDDLLTNPPIPSGSTPGATTPHPRDMYSLLSGNQPQPTFYLSSAANGFVNSPISSINSSSPTEQTSSTSPLDHPAPAPTSIARPLRSGLLPLGLSGTRTLPLIPSSNHVSAVQQQLSPLSNPQLSSHPHMHPPPYYSIQHQSQSVSSPYPSTSPISHHNQGSSSSSHSSGHTRYSLRGSPGARAFGNRHVRSSSFGTVSTMSVRSSSPANSVASAFTSLSGGGTPSSATGPAGSPTSYGESNGEATVSFTETSPPARAQSHPPLSMPTAHPALAAYSTLLPQRKGLLQQEYLSPSSEEPRVSNVWPPPPPVDSDFTPDPPMGDFQSFHSKQVLQTVAARTPHRKQKLANADRKAICMYAKQHPNARQEDIAARYNVERSTISKILKNKERWLGCPDDEAKVARKRKPRFDDLELVLKLWVEDTRDQGIILSDALIRSKAKEEARQLGISEDKFKASSGWLENFKHRVGIRKGKYVGREPWGLGDADQTMEGLSAARLQEEDALQKQQRVLYAMDTSPAVGYEGKGLWHTPEEQDERAPPEMRKTRSRTLAEARESARVVSSPSSPALVGPGSSGSGGSDTIPPPTTPDGREASAGLDVALGYIGCQPEGFATPEEVAVLRGLSRKMSRVEWGAES